MNKLIKITFLSLIIGFLSCKTPNANNAKKAVISNYTNIVYETYLNTYKGALSLQEAVKELINSPSESNLLQAKNAWLTARNNFGQTEAFRECNGPIDTENEVWGIAKEGKINAWPVDESYIDYVLPITKPYSGDYVSVISDVKTYPVINEIILAELNEADTDKSISTGWHAIEFLLWGQDNTLPIENLAGQRKYTDYKNGTNAKRRGQYLQAVTDLLVNDLKQLVDTWAPDGTYRRIFQSLEKDIALKQLINGAFFIAGDELSSERMIAPVDSTDGIDNSGQEDEQSCFSDNTHNDIWANAQGVYNVVFGIYDNDGNVIKGSSFYDLVLEKNPEQAAILKKVSEETMEKINVIRNSETPFDYLITKENSIDTEFGVVMQAVESLNNWSDEISASAISIGITL